jgi:hypothetical protein
MKTNAELLQMKPIELQNWLTEEFELTKEIPTDINTIEDMEKASHLIGLFTNRLSYLTALGVYAKMAVRAEKRKGKENKELADDMIDRQYAIDAAANIVKQQYTAVSRMITVKQEINKEIYMSESFAKKN